MSTDHFSRREFLEIGAVTAGASLVGRPHVPGPLRAAARPATPASDRVRFGMIGVGMQGSGLLAESIRVDGVECAAACDLYDGRHTLAREITSRADLPVTRRYQELLDNRDIDCVVVAVPDHWHKQIVVDALGAGKDVYIEKPMSHSPAEGVAMVDAARRSGRIVQVGSQRPSSQLYARAKEMVASGILGDLTLIDASLGRNDPTGAWEYPPPPDLSPENLDWETWLGSAPKRPFDPMLFARWRCWKEYGTGVAGDLLVHLVTGMMYMLDMNQPPTRAMSVGAIRRWKDGRNMPDVHVVSFSYGDLPVSMRLNLGTETPEGYRLQGSKGLLEVVGNTITFTPQSGRDMAPSYYTGSYPKALRDAYVKQWHAENDPPLGHAPMTEATIIRVLGANDTRAHLANFFDAVRSRKPLVEDALFGHHAALACHMANESYFRQAAVTWDPSSRTIRA